jgi:hypothetical protein
MTERKDIDQMPERNSRTFSWIVSIGIGAATLLAGYFYWLYRENLKTKPIHLNEKYLTDAFIEAGQKIQERYVQGDKEGLLTSDPLACAQFVGPMQSTSSSYTRCNPDFLDCFYRHLQKNADLQTIVNNKKYNFNLSVLKNQKIYQTISRNSSPGSFLPSYGIEIELKSKEHSNYSMRFIFEDSCHDIFLPRRKFAYGEEGKKELLEWDNLDSNLFVDRFLVSNRDIREWSFFTGKEVLFDKDKLSSPATSLTYKQMKEFCAYKGKSILKAHVLDAASFLPSDRLEPEPLKVKRGPYYWTKDSKQTFLAQKNKKLINKENCAYAYVKDCLGLADFDSYYLNPSWMGLNIVLGGPLEVVENNLEPLKNLKASSYYFDISSAWHVLGKRAFWNGEGHELKDFDFGKETPDMIDGKLGVAFRCMKTSPFILKESDEEI